jgi:phosphoribosylaminoimidazole-succinocarboxamide synthase
MNRRRKIYEGKAKILFEGPEPGTLVQYFKDDTTAGDGARHEIIDGKGVLRLNMREQLIKEVEIIPLEIIVRNFAAGSLVKRLGLEPGTQLPRSIIEFCYKDDALHDPMVSEEHITAFGWATPAELDDIMSLAIRVNDFLTGLFMGVGIQLVDFKIECGRLYEGDLMRIVLADEISPDSCRLWDIKTRNKMDNLGGLIENYREVAQRLGILVETDNALTTGPRLVQ